MTNKNRQIEQNRIKSNLKSSCYRDHETDSLNQFWTKVEDSRTEEGLF